MGPQYLAKCGVRKHGHQEPISSGQRNSSLAPSPETQGKVLIGPAWVMCLPPGSVSLGGSRGWGCATLTLPLGVLLRCWDPAREGPTQSLRVSAAVLSPLLALSWNERHIPEDTASSVSTEMMSDAICILLFPLTLPVTHRTVTSSSPRSRPFQLRDRRTESGTETEQFARGHANRPAVPCPVISDDSL